MQRSDNPFPHLIVDNAFDPRLVAEADAQWPGLDWDGWGVHYESLLESGKRTCNAYNRVPPACQLLLGKMAALSPGLLFPELDLVPDLGLWGGGMHSMAAGSHLDLHEDSDMHPYLRWNRRLNAILFVNQDWPEAWGGHLEFWDAGRRGPEAKILPAFNRLVLFDVGDGTFHGIPEPVRCPPGVQRKTLALFWFTRPTEGQVFKRPRANFVGPAGEDRPDKEALRKERVKPLGS